MTSAGKLAGRRILVVEDEYFIASDLKVALGAAGATVVGPVADVARALELAAGPLDAAVLDVNLNGRPSYPVARRLRECAVPFVFVTGYDGWTLPDEFHAVPCLVKPAPVATMVELAARLIDADAPA